MGDQVASGIYGSSVDDLWVSIVNQSSPDILTEEAGHVISTEECGHP